MTCQDDLIEFREKMEMLKRKSGRNKRQFRSEDSRVTSDPDHSRIISDVLLLG